MLEMVKIPKYVGLLLLLFLMGCQTFWGSRYVPVYLPVTYDNMFGTCHDSDGGGELTVNNKRLTIQNSVEWISKPKTLDLRIYDQLGKTVLTLTEKSGKFTLNGPIASHLHRLHSDSHDFLVLGDEWIGIKTTEIGCLLNQVWPRIWLKRVTDFEEYSESNSATAAIVDSSRSISIQMHHDLGGKVFSCAEISWRKYLVFSANIKICHDLPKKSTAIELEDVEIKWRRES